MNTLPRNQIDASKKRFSNVLVRCGEHGWECRELKQKAEAYNLDKIMYGDLNCFHYHTRAGINFKNFKEKFDDVRCQLNFYPIPGGLSKYFI